ncbi:hypothetical protein ACFL0W_03295 [Nanoarchaeota archaeon]
MKLLNKIGIIALIMVFLFVIGCGEEDTDTGSTDTLPADTIETSVTTTEPSSETNETETETTTDTTTTETDTDEQTTEPDNTTTETADNETEQVDNKALLEKLMKEKGLISDDDTGSGRMNSLTQSGLTTEQPEIAEKCTEQSSFLFISCYFERGTDNKVAKLSLSNQARETIEGFSIHIKLTDDRMYYTELPDDVPAETNVDYTLSFGRWEEEMNGTIQNIEVHSEDDFNGTIKSCHNQRIRFVPKVNCKDKVQLLA